MAYTEANFGNLTLTDSLVFMKNTQRDNYAFCQVSRARQEVLKKAKSVNKNNIFIVTDFSSHTTSYLAIELFDCNSFMVCVCVCASVLACFALDVYMLNCNNT